MMLMTFTEISNRRLQHQHLTALWLKHPADLVAWLGVVQAQDYAGAKWALGLRLAHASDASVEQALSEGTIIRTHVLRPTWHFVAPADIRWMLALTAPRIHALNAAFYRKYELDTATLRRSRQVLTQSLQAGQHRTRDELRAAFNQAGVAVDDNLRMVYLMMHAELEGVVCSGARRGKQFTYALLEERAPQARALPREEALCELTRRYFTSHGPATLHDFVWWSGLTVTDAKRALAALAAELERSVYEGKEYWIARQLPDSKSVSSDAFLLPSYDECTVGYRERGAWAQQPHAESFYLGQMMLLRGRLAGTWKRTLKPQSVVLELNAFSALKKTENSAVQQAARRYGAFVGLPVTFD